MKNIILFDDENVREDLLPLSFTRPVSNIRFGISTIREKWEREFPDAIISYLTTSYLKPKFHIAKSDKSIYILGNVCPNNELVGLINEIQERTGIFYNDFLIAYHGCASDFKNKKISARIDLSKEPLAIWMLYDIFMKNDEALYLDYKSITAGRISQPLSNTNTIIGNPRFEDGSPKIFLEPGARIEGSFLNVNNGVIYIGKNAEVMEGCAIRSSFAAAEHAVVNMGTKIYGATTIGPYCKVGGELNNVMMIGYSNKAHDGFLGNAVIGEWCNLGAGCVASNLKNDYTEIKLWNYKEHRFLRTGLQFCGLIMGDHSKAGINTMFNTATVIGVGVNVHGTGFPRNFVASFSEGSTAGFSDVPLTKFFSIAERMMARRNVELSEIDRRIFEAIYTIADAYK